MKSRGSTEATGKQSGPRRTTRAEVETDILATTRELAQAMHQSGAMTGETLREIDALCDRGEPSYGGADVQRIRAATKMDALSFARLLGVGEGAVARWEKGANRPTGPAIRLLEILDPERPDSAVVELRRSLAKSAA